MSQQSFTTPDPEESAPLESPHQAPHNHDAIRSTAEMIRTIVLVVGLAIVLRTFVFQPYAVEGASMSPKFATRDHLIVDKLSYNFGTPQRGDIIVFKYPNDPSTNYVKRVIGLPGEKVQFDNGSVRIITNDNPEGFILNESQYLSESVKTTLSAMGRTEFTVTKDHYFVMGDNRPFSSDSRDWGLLPKENIVGRVILKTYPFDQIQLVNHARYSK